MKGYNPKSYNAFEEKQKKINWMIIICLLLITSILWIPEIAKGADEIGSSISKGIIFKDKIKVFVFDDPDIKGITCYTTRYERSLSLVDSTNSSLACRQTGPINMFQDIPQTKREVFSQEKGFIFLKTTLVDRFIDFKRKVIVYLSYTKSLGNKNSSHSISVVRIK